MEKLFDDEVITGNDNTSLFNTVYYKQVIKCIVEFLIKDSVYDVEYKSYKLSDNEYIIKRKVFDIFKVSFIDNEIHIEDLPSNVYFNNTLGLLGELHDSYNIDISKINFSSSSSITCSSGIVNSYICEHMPVIDSMDECYLTKCVFKNINDFMNILNSLLKNNNINGITVNTNSITIKYKGNYRPLSFLIYSNVIKVLKIHSSARDSYVTRKDIEKYFKVKNKNGCN